MNTKRVPEQPDFSPAWFKVTEKLLHLMWRNSRNGFHTKLYTFLLMAWLAICAHYGGLPY